MSRIGPVRLGQHRIDGEHLMPCRLKCGVYAGADETGGAGEENLHAVNRK